MGIRLSIAPDTVWFWACSLAGLCGSGYNGGMRVVMVSKALVVGAYQRKAEELARCGIELTVLVPPEWSDRRGRQEAEQAHTAGYDLCVVPVRLNGQFHLHYYPTLAAELRRLRPDLLHMDEEPYNTATWLGLAAAARLNVPSLFFTWQNIKRRYPPPFRWMEQANYRRAAAAIAGNAEAAEVLRAKGYRGAVYVLPQFGVDTALFAPVEQSVAGNKPAEGVPLHIGYAGGLLAEKGLDVLLRACAELGAPWRLTLCGEGSERPRLAALAGELGIASRVRFLGPRPSTEMPAFYRELDVFVLPSRTTRGWKEQFGRVLVEAMASGVAVVGSDSGEIPHVIGDAGLVVPEGNVEALAAALIRLWKVAERQQFGAAGRARVLARFTMQRVAAETAAIYAETLHKAG